MPLASQKSVRHVTKPSNSHSGGKKTGLEKTAASVSGYLVRSTSIARSTKTVSGVPAKGASRKSTYSLRGVGNPAG